jgi:hypothetical protein
MATVNIKRAALFCAVATALSVTSSGRSAFISLRLNPLIPSVWKSWFLPLMLLLVLLDATLPLCYFALYRSKVDLSFPKWSRVAALMVACAAGADSCIEAARYVQSAAFPTPTQISALLAEICCVVLLIQVYRNKDSVNSTRSLPSDFFVRVRRLSGFWGGLWIAVGCLQFAATPFNYKVVRHIAAINGRASPTFGEMLMRSAGRLIYTACLWCTPWLLYTIARRQKKRLEAAASKSGLVA